MTVTAQLRLPRAKLVVELRQDDALTFLDVRSRIDPRQQFLLPLPPPPQVAGFSLFTRLGRLHAVYWGFAYGAGTLPSGSLVRFQAERIRYRRTVEVVPQQLADQCWIAEAEGVFSTVSTVTADVETSRIRLTDRW